MTAVPDQVAERFGPVGLSAPRIARGEEEPLRRRVPHEDLVGEIELSEGACVLSPGKRTTRETVMASAGSDARVTRTRSAVSDSATLRRGGSG